MWVGRGTLVHETRNTCALQKLCISPHKESTLIWGAVCAKNSNFATFTNVKLYL